MSSPHDKTCTCRAPGVVDLTEAYLGKHGVTNCSGVPRSGFPSSSSHPDLLGSSDCRRQLLHNLKHFGWSHVSLQISRIPPTSPLRRGSCRNFWRNNGSINDTKSSSTPGDGKCTSDNDRSCSTKQTLTNLFHPELIAFASDINSSINRSSTAFPVYRTAESGSAGVVAIEPKQSWEMRRCRSVNDREQPRNDSEQKLCQDGSEDRTLTQRLQLLQDIPEALHSVATTVNEVLQLPANVLMHEPRATCSCGSSCSCGCECRKKQQQQQDEDQVFSPTNPCNMDLLRVFYYDAVPTNKQRSESNQQLRRQSLSLGSSAHTDWGSWTVVWQDQVGGLQTWCSSCHGWRNVEASFDDIGTNDSEKSLLRFVIHVGDTTSLALTGACQQLQQDHARSTKRIPAIPLFPSPKHRVLSPSTEPRASLVYFVYPPPGRSLEFLSMGLSDWCKQHVLGVSSVLPQSSLTRVPSSTDASLYDSYYLLRDQSISTCDKEEKESQESSLSSKQVFDKIYKQNLDEVYAEKWQQVQRAS